MLEGEKKARFYVKRMHPFNERGLSDLIIVTSQVNNKLQNE